MNEFSIGNGLIIQTFLGDCLDVMQTIPDNSIAAIVTSPPYAQRREKNYGGIDEDQYVDWFMPIFRQMKRVLTDDGSIFINIKPHVHRTKGRSLYVMKLVQAIVEQEMMYFMDEFCWTKPDPYPGSFGCRLKNAWESVYHFTKRKKVKFYPQREARASAKSTMRKITNGSYLKNKWPVSQSGMSPVTRASETALPSNHIIASSGAQGLKREHPAIFPLELPRFLINIWTDEGDTVLDPFAGSGTVGVACRILHRNCILIEKHDQYYQLINRRVLIENI